MTAVDTRVRSVLAASHGARFTRTSVPAPRWERAERNKAGQAKRWEPRSWGTESDDLFPPRRSRGRHRAPRWWRSDWAASTLTFGVALVAGMVVSHVTALLL